MLAGLVVSPGEPGASIGLKVDGLPEASTGRQKITLALPIYLLFTIAERSLRARHEP